MLFERLKDDGRAAAVRRVKEWVEALWTLGADDALMVKELQCVEEGCPPVETVIALLRPGERTRKWTVHKTIADVTEADVRGAILGRSRPDDPEG